MCEKNSKQVTYILLIPCGITYISLCWSKMEIERKIVLESIFKQKFERIQHLYYLFVKQFNEVYYIIVHETSDISSS